MLPTKPKIFCKTLNLNNRLYDLKLNLEPTNSVLTFNVSDKTNPQNPQNFSNSFSLNQDEKIQNQQICVLHLKKIVNF